MTKTAPLELAADFPIATTTDWLALVAKSLGPDKASPDGAARADGLERLRSRIDDDSPIEPLYLPENSASPSPLRRAEPADPERAWDVRTLVYDPDPAHANAFALSDLNGGATSLTVAVDLGGDAGLSVATRDDLAHVLKGVLLDVAPVGLDAGFLGAEAATWLGDLAKGAPAAPLAFNLDPLGAFASAGRSPGPVMDILAGDVDVAIALAQTYPKASLFMASGLPVHEGGGSIGQELGFALACALAYAKALAAKGVALTQAFDSLVLCLAADADYFTTLAKFRAGRLLMTRLASACGVQMTPKLEARSSRRMLARVDPWPNLLRLASACAGAAMGGADIIQLAPFTFPATYAMEGRSSSLARRQARNIQLVLMEESGLGRVNDPAEGSWFLDTLSDTLARWGWTYFQLIEGQGGALQALKQDDFGQRVEAVFRRRARDLRRRQTCLVGVTDFVDLDGVGADVLPWGTTPRPRRHPRLQPRADDDRGLCFSPQALDLGAALRARHALAGRPKVYLATLGDSADFARRVAFARDLVAVGGFSVEVGAASAYDPAATPVAILCGSDGAYAAEGAAAAASLKAAGAERVILAGRPGDRGDDLRTVGVDDFIYAGCDVVEPLERLLQVFERDRAEAQPA